MMFKRIQTHAVAKAPAYSSQYLLPNAFRTSAGSSSSSTAPAYVLSAVRNFSCPAGMGTEETDKLADEMAQKRARAVGGVAGPGTGGDDL